MPDSLSDFNSREWCLLVVCFHLVDRGDRIGNDFRPLICVVITSDCEWKLTQRRCQSNEGGLLHTVK